MRDEQIYKDISKEEFDALDEEQKFNKIKDLELVWRKTSADFDNFRKRTAAERGEILQHAKELTVLKLLPSLQSLEQVLKYAPEDEKYKDWIAGLRATIQQLEKTMEELGVVKIKTVGEQFDPTHHEAVEETEGEPGKVIQELQPGFMLNNQVIIPAKVAVGK